MIDPQEQIQTSEKTHPDIGQWFTDATSKQFEMLGVFNKDGSLWAHYKNTLSNEEYTCTLAAFKQRFTPTPK